MYFYEDDEEVPQDDQGGGGGGGSSLGEEFKEALDNERAAANPTGDPAADPVADPAADPTGTPTPEAGTGDLAGGADPSVSPESQSVVDDLQDGKGGSGGSGGTDEQHTGSEDTKGDKGGSAKGSTDEKSTNPPGGQKGGEGGPKPPDKAKPPVDAKGGGGGSPKGGGTADMVKAGVQGMQQDGVKGAAKEVAKEKAKKEAMKTAAKVISKIPPVVLFWIAVVVLIIIIAVGIIMFFVAVPGQIVTQCKSLANSVIRAWSEMIHGKDKVVSTSQIANVANYVESMGYDLKGEGFVTRDKVAEDISNTINDIKSWTSTDYNEELAEGINAGTIELYADPVQGVIRRKDNEDVVDINSDCILSYIISDNQCYMIKNLNTNLDDMTGGNGDLWGTIIGIVAAVVGILVAIIVPGGIIISAILGAMAAGAVGGVSYLAITMASNPDWGSGLISIYHEAGMGKRGKYYDMKEHGEIDLDPKTKKLSVKRGWANGTIVYDVDGWSGRYGIPLEFLLSVHLATQMPDLAIDIATKFNTNVDLLLHEVNGGKVTAGVLKKDISTGSWRSGENEEDFLTYDLISELGHQDQSTGQSILEWLKNAANDVAGFFAGDKPWTAEELETFGLTDRVLTKLFYLGLPHASACTCCECIYGSAAYFNEPEDSICNAKTYLPDPEDIGDDLTKLNGEFESSHPYKFKEVEKFSGSGKTRHIICDACKERASQIVAALSQTSDRDYESYTPYISNVTDHWFRDVYFVMNDSEGEYQGAIKVDEDYFYETGERWTMYEVWKSTDTIPTDPDSDDNFKIGDYKLYDPSDMEHPSTLTKKQVQEINEKIANGDTTVTRLVKKPIMDMLDKNFDDGWTAYTLTDPDVGDDLPWTQIAVGKDSIGELKTDAVYKNENAGVAEDIIIYYKEMRPGDIKQIEDGQRAQTNEKIKTMFLYNKYYKYDGNVDRATAIMEDRQNYTESDAANFNTDNDPRNEKLLAKVNITKDSLGAFSILTNTHTLDADYIYRDFKELIVELNYFDKEDLSDKIENVMQWPIPDCGSGGWPIRKYEKGETYYGTLINSKVDLDYMKDLAVTKAEATLGKLDDEVPDDTTHGLDASLLGGTTPDTSLTGSMQLETSGDVQTTLVGAGSAPNISIDKFVQIGYDVHAIMDQGSPSESPWDYCVLHRKEDCTIANHKSAHCNHKNGHSCGLKGTVQEADEQLKNTCCATFTSWVLKEAGFDLSDHPGMHGAKASYQWCKANGWKEITSLEEMEAGDFLFNNGSDINNIGHVQMQGNNGEWLNGGSVGAMNSPATAYTPDSFIIAMRPPLEGTAEPFEGYEPEQDVVAPATGRVVEYGEVERKNIETGEKEHVGYIKIHILDHYITSGEGNTVTNICNNADKTYKDYNTDSSKKEGYDYFYEEYKGVLDGCVIYMEGFELTLDETLGKSVDDETVSRYEGNNVDNMTDDIKEAQALWREDAKDAALPFFRDGEDIYIKEGTVIGKTYDDPDGFPPDEIIVNEEGVPTSENPVGSGNYIRLILRDLEDSIIEDVETYLKIDELLACPKQPYQAQEGDLELLANLIHHEGCEGGFRTFDDFGGNDSLARDAARTTGYVCINRALVNYGHYGTTIREQIVAPGQYSTAYDVTSETASYCDLCLADAEWCLAWDCMSVDNNRTDGPMQRNCLSQSGWCFCNGEKFHCWWWIDSIHNGQPDESDAHGSVPPGWDEFFCKIPGY